MNRATNLLPGPCVPIGVAGFFPPQSDQFKIGRPDVLAPECALKFSFRNFGYVCSASRENTERR